MHSGAQTVARLRSMIFLIEEALRIADEGDNPLLGAKLSDCIDCVLAELAQIESPVHTGVEPGFDMLHRGGDAALASS